MLPFSGNSMKISPPTLTCSIAFAGSRYYPWQQVCTSQIYIHYCLHLQRVVCILYHLCGHPSFWLCCVAGYFASAITKMLFLSSLLMVTFLFKKLCSCFVVYSTNVQPIKEMRGREKGGGKRIEKNKGRRKKKRGKVCE